MKAIFSNYNFTPNWINQYYDDYIIFDRSDSREYLNEFPQDKIKIVPNIGTDIWDKFNWIIENYEYLPPVVLLSKSNLFKYISKEEFDLVKDNTKFTPLLTKNHEEKQGICYYKDGIYWEINNGWYLESHPVKTPERINTIMELMGYKGMRYVPFAPGSNYILPKENIIKHPKEKYEKLRSLLEWSIYPGEAQLIERGLFKLWS